MEMNVVTTGIAWAVPVRPDTLGKHVEAYEKSLKTIQALRLCHRYGKGSNVHINKLPTEVLLLIEDFVFLEKLDRFDPWQEYFRHFERRCEPAEHLEDGDCDIYEDAKGECLDKLCDKCKDPDSWADCDNCRAIVDSAINEQLYDVDEWQFDTCEPKRDQWLRLINQNPGGNFRKYDEILRKHFGLETSFANTRMAISHRWTGPEMENSKWHDSPEDRETTICHLTLPKLEDVQKSYSISDGEASLGSGILMNIAQTMFVDVPSLQDREKRVKQFQRALRTLKLQPYLHPSQLNVKSSSNSADQALAPSEDDMKTAEAIEKKKAALLKQEWPQLVVLVKTESEW